METNAKQLYMTGIAVLHKDCNVIVVEGGKHHNYGVNLNIMVLSISVLPVLGHCIRNKPFRIMNISNKLY